MFQLEDLLTDELCTELDCHLVFAEQSSSSSRFSRRGYPGPALAETSAGEGLWCE